MTSTSQQSILFVDDNPGDLLLAREALEESGLGTQLCSVTNGEEALKFLRTEPPYQSAPKPDVVLLDLNMPRKGGIQTLKEIREDSVLQSIPVIIFSSSPAQHDRAQADLHNANDYIIKPHALHDFIRAICTIENTWCVKNTTTVTGAP